MENQNVDGAEGVVDSVSASSEAQASSQQATSQVDPLKNLKAEMNRKLSKLTETVSTLAATIQQSQKSNQVAPVEETETPDYKRYVDARFQETHQSQVKQGQEQAWQKALEIYPELNQDSEQFDEKFFKLADRYYGSFDLTKDSEAPLKAVKLAALEVGKIEQLTKERLLKDEARRSRIISEGGTAPRESKQEKEPEMDANRLAKLGIKDPEKLKARIKANPNKYGKGN
jgi:uncharacterized phage infection (PIP) family protein YhgE